jgi:hypothetical protein
MGTPIAGRGAGILLLDGGREGGGGDKGNAWVGHDDISLFDMSFRGDLMSIHSILPFYEQSDIYLMVTMPHVLVLPSSFLEVNKSNSFPNGSVKCPRMLELAYSGGSHVL